VTARRGDESVSRIRGGRAEGDEEEACGRTGGKSRSRTRVMGHPLEVQIERRQKKMYQSVLVTENRSQKSCHVLEAETVNRLVDLYVSFQNNFDSSKYSGSNFQMFAFLACYMRETTLPV
jgi:hypothetical protein